MFQKILFIGLISISGLLHAENYNFQPGLWKSTTTQEVIEIVAPPGIKKMMQHLSQMPMSTETECFNNISSMFDPEPDDVEECKTTMTRVNSNKIAVETVCAGEDGTSKGAGEINLNGKTFTSSFVMSSTNGPMKMKMKMKIIGSGEYIGACK